jgi:hypothetical protein
MGPGELAEAVELIAHRVRRQLTPAQVETLLTAAQRVRRLEGLREALLDRLGTIERLERELGQLRSVPPDNEAGSAR